MQNLRVHDVGYIGICENGRAMTMFKKSIVKKAYGSICRTYSLAQYGLVVVGEYR